MTQLALRPIGPNDYLVVEHRQPIGRIRLARERSPPIWVWHVTVTILGPPFGDAKSIADAKDPVQGGVDLLQRQGRRRGAGRGLCGDGPHKPAGSVIGGDWQRLCRHRNPSSEPRVSTIHPSAGESVTELPLILVIEDEYLAQRDVAAALADGGFASEAVFSSEEALTLLMDGVGSYSALVTDVRLGGNMSGWDVAKRIREKEPAFPVIYVTANAADQWASHGVPNSILISKPFAPAQLVTAVSNLLNTGTPPAT